MTNNLEDTLGATLKLGDLIEKMRFEPVLNKNLKSQLEQCSAKYKNKKPPY